MNRQIKIIDLFSGPGGLGEGFSAFKTEDGISPFKIAISIEKEKSAYRTLKLRAFFRQFDGNPPKEYYDFLKGKLGNTPEEKLYQLSKYSEEVLAAENEAQLLELGLDNKVIYKKIGETIGKDDCVLIGGPPCQAYSLAGIARNRSNADYDAKKDPRNFLYKEYLQIIAKFQPVVFVMENVKGMLSAKIDGKSIYETILSDLKNPKSSSRKNPVKGRKSHKYQVFSLEVQRDKDEQLKPQDFVVRSELHGIPQRRHRVILLGVREDFVNKLPEVTLPTCKSQSTVFDVINDLPHLRSGLSKRTNTARNWMTSIARNSVNTIDSLRGNGQSEIAEKLCEMQDEFGKLSNEQGCNLSQKRVKNLQNETLKKWYYDPKLGRNITNHETRGHLESDLQRYLFCSVWGLISKELSWVSRTPKSKDYPEYLIPNHKNFKSGKFADRFRVQVWDLPATTITCHISKDGHYYIHPDPFQCRSLTVREAARIQTFPDNYFFVGNRTEQYVQVGNAVPPLLAIKIADIVAKILT
jgi:DNA (cytosine-5)-methyltransferase 1